MAYAFFGVHQGDSQLADSYAKSKLRTHMHAIRQLLLMLRARAGRQLAGQRHYTRITLCSRRCGALMVLGKC